MVNICTQCLMDGEGGANRGRSTIKLWNDTSNIIYVDKHIGQAGMLHLSFSINDQF